MYSISEYAKALEIRFIVVALLAIFGVFMDLTGVLNLHSLGFWMALSIFLTHTGIFWYLFKKKFSIVSQKSINLLWTSQYLDVFLLTIVIYFLGSHDTMILVVLYHTLVLTSYSPKAFRTLTFTKANLCMVLFGSVLLLEYWGILPHIPVGQHFLSNIEQVALVFFVAASLNGCAMFHVKKEEEYLKQVALVEEANLNLEKKVEEKTHKLIEANQKISSQFSEIKETHQILVQAEKMASLGTMVEGLCHEIFNPLHTISIGTAAMKKYTAYIEKMAEAGRTKLGETVWQDISQRNDGRNWDDVKHRLGNLQQQVDLSVERIINIVLNVKNLSRADTEEYVEIKIPNLIDEVLTILAPMIEEKDARIIWAKKEDCVIRGMRGGLSQVLINVVKNSLDAINMQGHIWLVAQKREGLAKIQIRDDGIGIPAEDLDKVFDPFFTTKDSDRGTGLGLSISHRTITIHNGQIEIRSQKDKGTLVDITIPA